MIKIARVGDTVDCLGEGLLWDAEAGVLYWADATQGLLRRLDPATGERVDHRLPGQIGTVVLRRAGGAVVTLEDGFYTLDLATGGTELLLRVPQAEGLRFNDGKVDRQGRLVAGTMHIRPPATGDYAGTLYRLDADGSLAELEHRIGNVNGPCFSPDGATFYFTDTPRRAIYAYDYDTGMGRLSARRVFFDSAELDTSCDGITVDAEGFLWAALFSIGKVARLAPDGRVDRLIDMPMRHPTNVAFGGPDLDVLYVTSLSKSPNFAAAGPADGSLQAVRGLGVTGLAEPRFAG